MSLNLLEILKGTLGNEVVGKLGGILGESEEKTQAAVGGALPALLGSFMGKASTPAGAEALSAQLDQDDGGVLDNLGGLLGGASGGQAGLMDKGSGILSGLLGDKLGGVTDIISKVSGLGQGNAGSLIGMLAPIVMGVLGKQKRSLGLDASGLSNLLASQKDHVAAAMPAGMGDALGIGNLISGDGGSIRTEVSSAASSVSGAVGDAAGSVVDGVKGAAGAVGDAAGNAVGAVGDAAGSVASGAAGAVKGAAGAVGDATGSAVGAVGDAAGSVASGAAGAVKGAAGAVGNAAGSAVDGAGRAAGAVGDAAGDAAAAGGSLIKKLLPLALLIGLVFLALKLIKSPGADKEEGVGEPKEGVATVVDGTRESIGSAGVAAGAEGIGATNAVSGLSNVFESATSTFGSINDVKSAEAAVPQIEEMTEKVGGIAGMLDKVPAPMRGKVMEVVSGFAPKLNGMVDKAYAIPGVKPVLEPAVGKLMEKLGLFTS